MQAPPRRRVLRFGMRASVFSLGPGPGPALGLALCLLGGCSQPAAPLDPGPAADARPAAEADLGDCQDPGNEKVQGGLCLRSVSGRVVDPGGAPVPSLVVTVCADACFFGKTDGEGRFRVDIDAYLRTSRYSVLLHGQPSWSAYYLPLPAGSQGVVTLEKPLPLLPMPTDGPTIARDGSAQTLRQGGVTLTLEAGTDVFLSPEDASAGAVGGRLRPLRVADPSQLPFLAGQPKVDLAYAFGPFESAFSKPARVSVDNTLGLPAGAAVDWLAPRSLTEQGPTGGAIEVIGAGKVSADGARIDLDGGVKALTWLLIRRR